MCAREREECALNSDDAKLFFLGWLLSERRRREKTAAKNSSETLNPNFQVFAAFRGAFFWPKWNQTLVVFASIRAAKSERELDPLVLSLNNEKKVSVLRAFFLSLSSCTSETTGGVRSERERGEEILKERVKEREFCVQFSLIGKRHWQREKLAALLWSRTGKRGEN